MEDTSLTPVYAPYIPVVPLEDGDSPNITMIGMVLIFSAIIAVVLIIIFVSPIRRIISLPKGTALELTPDGYTESETFVSKFLYNSQSERFLSVGQNNVLVGTPSPITLWSFDGRYLTPVDSGLYVRVTENSNSLSLQERPDITQSQTSFSFVFEGGVFYSLTVMTSTQRAFIMINSVGGAIVDVQSIDNIPNEALFRIVEGGIETNEIDGRRR